MIFISMFLAVVVGLGTTTYVVQAVTFSLARKSNNSSAVTRAGFIGATIAAVPAFFAALTVGGTFGGAWFEVMIGSSAIPVGIGVGIFAVFVGVAASVGALTATIVSFLVGTAPKTNHR